MIALEKILRLISLEAEAARPGEPHADHTQSAIHVERAITEILASVTIEEQTDLVALLWLGAGNYNTFEAARRGAKGRGLPPQPGKGQLSKWLLRGLAKVGEESAASGQEFFKGAARRRPADE